MNVLYWGRLVGNLFYVVSIENAGYSTCLSFVGKLLFTWITERIRTPCCVYILPVLIWVWKHSMLCTWLLALETYSGQCSCGGSGAMVCLLTRHAIVWDKALIMGLLVMVVSHLNCHSRIHFTSGYELLDFWSVQLLHLCLLCPLIVLYFADWDDLVHLCLDVAIF